MTDSMTENREQMTDDKKQITEVKLQNSVPRKRDVSLYLVPSSDLCYLTSDFCPLTSFLCFL